MSLYKGPSAFPFKLPHPSGGTFSSQGMTLRDYFAAKALQGELASSVDPEGKACGLALDISDAVLDRLTKHYYRIADAMLKAREAQ